MSETTILLVGEHHIVCEGLRALLEVEPDFHVIGEAASELETVQLAKQLHPDIVVVDVVTPELARWKVAQPITRCSPQTQVIILSAFDDDHYVTLALGSGAVGYVLKNDSATDLTQAIRVVIAGRRYLSHPLLERAIEVYVRHGGQVQDSVPSPHETLTPRECEVLFLAAKDYTIAEIATQLSISPKTVKVHRSNMRRKFGLRTTTDLVRYAMRRGILPA